MDQGGKDEREERGSLGKTNRDLTILLVVGMCRKPQNLQGYPFFLKFPTPYHYNMIYQVCQADHHQRSHDLSPFLMISY